MENGIELPNGHLLNLNPRPQINSNPNNRQSREAAVVQGSKLPTPESKGKTKARLDGAKDSGTMPKSSPTNLPVPKSLADKAKEQKKEKTVTIADNETPKTTTTTASATDSGRSKDKSVSPMTPGSENAITDRERRLRRLQDRLNKDSPLVAKSRGKQKEQSKGAYQKIMPLTGGSEGAKMKPRHSETCADDKLPNSGAKARTGIPSPSDKPRSTSGGLFRSPAVHHAPHQKRGPLKLYQKRSQQLIEESSNDSSSQESSTKTDKTTDSSSISPVSGPSNCATEWEDKFVVNMPSAKDPNPPMMTAKQIIEFQKSIEKVQREGGAMADPEASPSPRTKTPEDKDMRTSENSKPTIQGNSHSSAADVEVQTPKKEGNDQDNRRYYSPEEVGKQRFSTIWEESPTKSKKHGGPGDENGFFLGCKEINGPGKNPDEILYFSTTNERPKVIDIPSPVPAKPKAAGKPTGRRMVQALEDRIQIQKEWKTISENLRKRQTLPGNRTLCQESACPHPGKSQMPLPKGPGKEGGQTRRNSSNPVSSPSKDKESDNPGGDDVVMNIPNVSHAPAVPVLSAPKPPQKPHNMPASRVSAPPRPMSGLRQSSVGKDDPKTKTSPSGSTTTNTTSQSPPYRTSIHINKSRGEQRERPPGVERGVRGYMRIPGLVNSSTENFTESVRASPPRMSLRTSMSRDGAIADVNVPSRSVSGPAHITPDSSSLRGGSPVSAFFRDESRDVHDNTSTTGPSARIIEVAELDGHQLNHENRRRKTFTPSISTASSSRTTTTTTTTASRNNADSVDGNDRNTGPYPLTLNLLLDILIISITHFQRLTGDCLNSEYSQMVIRGVIGMVEHCIHVSRSTLLAISEYRATGTWPKTGKFNISQMLSDLGQALVYLIALGFVMIIIGRAAGYIVLIGSWVVWFAKPFGWAFGLLAKALAP